jgi:methyl-accepting chemotaxis protein
MGAVRVPATVVSFKYRLIRNRCLVMGAITGSTLQEQIQKAITAHGIFKVRLGQMVEAGGTEMAPAVAAADDQCPLGQWLYGGVDPSEKSGPQYQMVRDIHAAFHRAAGEVVALSSARKRTEALEAMEFGSTFKQASAKLVIALTTWADSSAKAA